MFLVERDAPPEEQPQMGEQGRGLWKVGNDNCSNSSGQRHPQAGQFIAVPFGGTVCPNMLKASAAPSGGNPSLGVWLLPGTKMLVQLLTFLCTVSFGSGHTDGDSGMTARAHSNEPLTKIVHFEAAAFP